MGVHLRLGIREGGRFLVIEVFNGEWEKQEARGRRRRGRNREGENEN